MSRLTGSDALGLYGAYQAVYNPQELTEEQVWEEVETWVNSLIEEGYDLSDYTWEEMYESYIEENTTGGIGSANRPGTAAQLQQRSRNVQARDGVFGQAYRAINRAFGAKEPSWDKADRDDRRREQTALNRSSNPNWNLKTRNDKDAKTRNDKDADTSLPKTPITTPASPKVAPTKPAAAAQTGDKAKDMDTWAKANPKLAAASAERDRTRGTSATTNPLMKDMKSRLPAPKTPSPTTSSTAFSKSTPSLGSSTPEVKSAGTSSGSAGFGKSAPSIGSSAFKPSPASAAPTPTPTTATATTPAAKPALKKPIVSGFDMFDVVKGYLIGEGYADTEEAALAIMTNMSEEWKQSIIKSI